MVPKEAIPENKTAPTTPRMRTKLIPPSIPKASLFSLSSGVLVSFL